jgi:hypothetical protein
MRAESTADATMRTRSSATDRRKATAVKDRLSLRKDMFKRRLQLAAESHVFQSREVPRGQMEDTMSLGGASSLPPQGPNGDRLLDLLRSVMNMEVNSEEASCRVAYEYFRLGKEYVEYINAREDNPPPVHSQSFHRIALPHLALLTKALTRSTLTHAALLKRLERAKKSVAHCQPIWQRDPDRQSGGKYFLSGHYPVHSLWGSRHVEHGDRLCRRDQEIVQLVFNGLCSCNFVVFFWNICSYIPHCERSCKSFGIAQSMSGPASTRKLCCVLPRVFWPSLFGWEWLSRRLSAHSKDCNTHYPSRADCQVASYQVLHVCVVFRPAFHSWV